MDAFSFGKVFCILFLAVMSVEGADDPTTQPPAAAATTQPPATKAVDVVTHLKVTTLLDPPFVMMSARGDRFRGFMVDILKEANKKIGFDTVDISINDEATFGGEEQPGAWNGLIGALQNESADVAMGAVTVTASRSKVVVFTQPVLTAGYRVLYKIPEAWNPSEAIVTVLRPFTPGLWVLIVLMFVVTSLSLYAIGRFSPYEDIAFVGKTATFEGLTLPNSLLYTFSTLVWQGYTASPKSISGRVLTCMWWVFSVFTVGAYIAGLVVILFRVNPEIRTLPFSNLDEMTRQTKVGIMVVNNSSAHRYLTTAHNSLEKKLFALITANPDSLVVDSTQEGINKMLKSDGAFALLMEAPAAEYLATQEPCNKMVIGEAVGSHYYAFACRNTSDVCQKMDSEILRMKEEGWLDQQRERWFKVGCMKNKAKAYVFEGLPFFDTFGGEPDLIMPMTITIKRFSAAFIILVIGIIISAICLAVEIFYARKRGTAVPRKLNHGGVDDDMERIENDFHDDPHVGAPSSRFGV